MSAIDISGSQAQHQHQKKELTLDSLFQSITHWHKNKKTPREDIPESIWDDVFILMDKFTATTLRNLLGISTSQFKQKLEKRSLKKEETQKLISNPLPSTVVDFCEAKQEVPSYQSLASYQPAKIPATNTLVVEFCRADGQIMKIHTTTDSFAALMKAFFYGGK